MVGDFRFGNRALENHTSAEDILSEGKEYTGISKELISTQNDRTLYDTSVLSIEKLSRNATTSFLFWDLSIREGENRMKGKYIENGLYNHPIWNLTDFYNNRSLSILDTRDIAENPMGMYVDSSAHPSLPGYVYILNRISGRNLAPSDILSYLDSTVKECFGAIPSMRNASVCVCGNSKFTRLLQKFSEEGAVPLPDFVEVDIHLSSPKSADLYLYFPQDYEGSSAEEEVKRMRQDQIFNKISDLKARHFVLPYDLWAREKISSRRELIARMKNGIYPLRTEAVENLICTPWQDFRLSSLRSYGGMIELGTALQPTAKGFYEILANAIFAKGEEKSRLIYNLISRRMFTL